MTATSAESSRISRSPRPSMRTLSRRIRRRTNFFVTDLNAAETSPSRPSNWVASAALTPSLMRSISVSRTCLPAMVIAFSSSVETALETASYTSAWYSRKMGKSPVALAAFEATSICASQRALMNGFEASRPWATTSSVGAMPPSAMRSIVRAVASASTIMMATSSPAMRPATTMSNTAF
ncbi:unannotated protein [freshwater metagenome]|uniref:Unannotated protein n=1 Tax=freshwater metagenome TaxID=449393 RepID=A0A6J7UZQ1_9ZZZZ